MTARHGSALWAVIPVKPFAAGKSRLMLHADQRADINRSFLDHVLGVACSVLPATHIIVVSRDDAALAAARKGGARALREQEHGDLNDALAFGAHFAAGRGAEGVLSLFADLPQLGRSDVEAMITAFTGDNVVIAPDEAGTGTNALMMAPNALPYRHGPDSLWRHLDAAREAGTNFSIIRREGLMRDVDEPADLAALVATRQSGGHAVHHGR